MDEFFWVFKWIIFSNDLFAYLCFLAYILLFLFYEIQELLVLINGLRRGAEEKFISWNMYINNIYSI